MVKVSYQAVLEQFPQLPNQLESLSTTTYRLLYSKERRSITKAVGSYLETENNAALQIFEENALYPNNEAVYENETLKTSLSALLALINDLPAQTDAISSLIEKNESLKQFLKGFFYRQTVKEWCAKFMPFVAGKGHNFSEWDLLPNNNYKNLLSETREKYKKRYGDENWWRPQGKAERERAASVYAWDKVTERALSLMLTLENRYGIPFSADKKLSYFRAAAASGNLPLLRAAFEKHWKIDVNAGSPSSLYLAAGEAASVDATVLLLKHGRLVTDAYSKDGTETLLTLCCCALGVNKQPDGQNATEAQQQNAAKEKRPDYQRRSDQEKIFTLLIDALVKEPDSAKRQAYLNQLDTMSFSALMWAAATGLDLFVRKLVDAGADAFVASNTQNPVTAFELALHYRQNAIFEYLVSRFTTELRAPEHSVVLSRIRRKIEAPFNLAAQRILTKHKLHVPIGEAEPSSAEEATGITELELSVPVAPSLTIPKTPQEALSKGKAGIAQWVQLEGDTKEDLNKDRADLSGFFRSGAAIDADPADIASVVWRFSKESAERATDKTVAESRLAAWRFMGLTLEELQEVTTDSALDREVELILNSMATTHLSAKGDAEELRSIIAGSGRIPFFYQRLKVQLECALIGLAAITGGAQAAPSDFQKKRDAAVSGLSFLLSFVPFAGPVLTQIPKIGTTLYDAYKSSGEAAQRRGTVSAVLKSPDGISRVVDVIARRMTETLEHFLLPESKQFDSEDKVTYLVNILVGAILVQLGEGSITATFSTDIAQQLVEGVFNQDFSKDRPPSAVAAFFSGLKQWFKDGKEAAAQKIFQEIGNLVSENGALFKLYEKSKKNATGLLALKASILQLCRDTDEPTVKIVGSILTLIDAVIGYEIGETLSIEEWVKGLGVCHRVEGRPTFYSKDGTKPSFGYRESITLQPPSSAWKPVESIGVAADQYLSSSNDPKNVGTNYIARYTPPSEITVFQRHHERQQDIDCAQTEQLIAFQNFAIMMASLIAPADVPQAVAATTETVAVVAEAATVTTGAVEAAADIEAPPSSVPLYRLRRGSWAAETAKNINEGRSPQEILAEVQRLSTERVLRRSTPS